MLKLSPDTRIDTAFVVSNTTEHLINLIRRMPWKPFKSSKRMTCSVGKAYAYSGQVSDAVSLDYYPPLRKLLERVNAHYGTEFNSILLNFYPMDSNCGIGAHGDNEPEIVPNTPIVSISLGANCLFNFHEIIPNVYPTPVIETVNLTDGTVFIMDEKCQKHYMHSISYGKMCSNRVSLTFRQFR